MGRTERKISVTISGSFNKHLDQIRQKILEFEHEGIRVLSPKPSQPVSRRGRFIILESDKGMPADIELKHLEAISKSDFLYIVNPEGYIGESVILEVGYALSRDIPIYSLEPPRDSVLSFFVTPEKSIKAIKRSFEMHNRERSEVSLTKRGLTLAELQDYVRFSVRQRGFENETIKDVLILFIEEIGELARAIRNLSGLKVSRKHLDSHRALRQELADCLMYLLDIANLANMDLEDALREKQRVNSRRKWRSREG